MLGLVGVDFPHAENRIIVTTNPKIVLLDLRRFIGILLGVPLSNRRADAGGAALSDERMVS
jgi:hypothetical protein